MFETNGQPTPIADLIMSAAAAPAANQQELNEIAAGLLEYQTRLTVSLMTSPQVLDRAAPQIAETLVRHPGAEQVFFTHFLGKLPQRSVTHVHQHDHAFDPTHWKWEKKEHFKDVTRFITSKRRVLLGALLGFVIGLVSMYFMQPGAFQIGNDSWQQTFSDAIDQWPYVTLIIVLLTIVGAMIGAFFRKEVTEEVLDYVEWRPVLIASGPTANGIAPQTNNSTPSIPPGA